MLKSQENIIIKTSQQNQPTKAVSLFVCLFVRLFLLVVLVT